MMKPTARQYARLLSELEEQYPKQEKPLSANFVGYLKRRKQLYQLPAIIAEYEQAKLEAAGAMRLLVSSARALSPTEQQELARFGQKLFGKQAAFAEPIVSPELIGGAVLTTAEERFDGSIRTSLRGLRQAITQQ